MDQALRRRSRWSDNDRYFGPFTFSWAGSKGYRPLALMLKSWGDGDDDAAPAECDCCGRMAELTQTWACGLETWACDECRGVLDHVAPESDDTEENET